MTNGTVWFTTTHLVAGIANSIMANVAPWSAESLDLSLHTKFGGLLDRERMGWVVTVFAVLETAVAEVEVWAILASDEFTSGHF